jgi:hypothetical protein
MENVMKELTSILGTTRDLKTKKVISDIISLFSLPQVFYTADNGFAFSLNISNYSETVKNITCHVIVPLLVIDGCFEFTTSILVGFEAGCPVFRIQEVGIQYVD